jgi:hypothetical protein
VDAATEAVVERVRRALAAKREAQAREQKANDALVAAKVATLAADQEANESQAALRALLLKQPASEVPPPTPIPPPEPPAKKPSPAKTK